MQRITFLILKTSKCKDQGLFRGKVFSYLTASVNDVFFAATVEPKQKFFVHPNCYLDPPTDELREGIYLRLLASKNTNCKDKSQVWSRLRAGGEKTNKIHQNQSSTKEREIKQNIQLSKEYIQFQQQTSWIQKRIQFYEASIKKIRIPPQTFQ